MMMLNDFYNDISDATDYPKGEVIKIVKATFKNIAKSLINGDPIQIQGFGTFYINTETRRPYNFRTKEIIGPKTTRIPRFKASQTLKEAVKTGGLDEQDEEYEDEEI